MVCIVVGFNWMFVVFFKFFLVKFIIFLWFDCEIKVVVFIVLLCIKGVILIVKIIFVVNKFVVIFLFFI